MSSGGQPNAGLRYECCCSINLLPSSRNLWPMLWMFTPSLELAWRNNRGFLEYQYSFHVGREDVVGLDCALSTHTVVLEDKGNFTQGSNEFLSEQVGFDRVVVCVVNGHNANVVFGLSASPLGFVFLCDGI